MRRSLALVAGLCCCTLTLGCTPEVMNALLANAAKNQSQAVAGGYTNQAVDSKLITDAAAKAILLLQAKTGDPTLKLIGVQAAATQVVAGLNFKLTLKVATGTGEKLVTLVMYRDLQQNDSLTSFDWVVPGMAPPSDVVPQPAVDPKPGELPMPGGYAEKPVDAPEVQEAAAKAIELMKTKLAAPDLRLVAVKQVLVQVVAGTNFKLVLIAEWQGAARELTVGLFRDLQGNASLTALDGPGMLPVNPPPPIPGGPMPQPVDSPMIKEAALKAIDLLKVKIGDPNLQLTGIKEASTQVVAGLNFKLTLGVNTGGEQKFIAVTMYRDLQQNYSLTSHEWVALPAPPAPAVGGYAPKPVDDPDIKDAALKAVDLLKVRAGDPALQLLTIKAAAIQVVAGLNYKLDLEVQTLGKTKLLTVVMYRDLAGAVSLTMVEGL